MKIDKDVPKILKNDGIKFSVFDQPNQDSINIPDLILKYGRSSSWSHSLIDTESNSATLICQLPGEGNRKHYHPDWNEWWYIVEGEWEWQIEQYKTLVKAGDIVFIKKNRQHKITALGNKCAIRLADSRYDVAHVFDEDD